MKAYENLFPQIIKEIEKRSGKTIVTTESRFSVQPSGEGGSLDSRAIAEIVTGIASDIADLIEPRIISGFDVTATTPPSATVNISSGTGTSYGKKWEITADSSLIIPLDSTTYVFYITVYNNAFEISKSHDDTKCEICRIIVPQPGTTSAIEDDKPSDGYNGYIVSAKDAVYGEDQEFDDASVEKLRDVFGEILSDTLIGSIKLSENLKITNTQGSIELDSLSMKIKDVNAATLAKFDRNGTFFYDTNGVIIAKFGVTEAYVGNMLLTKNSIETRNFLSGSTGFKIRDDGNAEFNDVVVRGTIYATLGEIGGFTIGSTALTAGSGSTSVGLIPATYPFYAGNATPSLAPFFVTPSGQLTCSNILATGGSIAGWILAATTLSDNATIDNASILIDKANSLLRLGAINNTYITIDGANKRIETSDYVSGELGSGWRIGTDTAEFQNIRARGKITTAVFEKETISSVGGNLLVMDSDILNADIAVDGATLTILGDTTFAANDILRMKDGENDEWLTITNASAAPAYTVTRASGGSAAAWKKGTAVVNYGASGAGGVIMTSSEEGISPYTHFFIHGGSPWSTTTPKTRIGNLAGIAGCTGYGIWAGSGYLGALSVIDLITISAFGTIRSNTSGNYPYVEFSNSGLQLRNSDTGGTYSTAVYSTGTYGSGALVWIMNSTYGIPWMEMKEPSSGAYTVSSMRFFNRSADPTGSAEVGDLAVVNGKLKICTTAGDPGAATWTVVGAQTA